MNEADLIELISDENAKKMVKLLYENRPSDLPEKPEKSTWYTYRPEGAMCSDGTPYYSTLRIGTENKLMILFCGGGVALNAYAAARPAKAGDEPGAETYYTGSSMMMGYFYGRGGIAKVEREDNPFRDWSVVIVQYATGDFHCGTNDFEYDDPELGKGVCHHRGYLNYEAMVEKIREFVPDPDEILVTGFSAGGWGTALLTDDVISRFPNCRKFTCLVDSAAVDYTGSHETAVKQWKAPKRISDQIVSSNMVLDCLLNLHRKYGDRVQIAFDSTYRDALLSENQNIADGKGPVFDKEGGDKMQDIIRTMTEILSCEIPNVSIYIFDKPNDEVKVGNLTDHTIIAAAWALDYAFEGHKFIDWLWNTVEGHPAKIGLDLLES